MISQQMIVSIESEELKLQARYKAANNAYAGIFPDVLKARPSDPNAEDNVKINKCRLIVDTGADVLFPGPLHYDAEEIGKAKPAEGESEQDTPAEEAAEEWLAEFWRQNKECQLLKDLAISGGIHGTPFLRMYPSKPDRPYPRVDVLDPMTVWPFWNPRDMTDIWGWKIQWNSYDWEAKKPVVFRTRIEREDSGKAWNITDEKAYESSRGFSLWDSMKGGQWQLISSERWPYPWAPVFYCKNLPAPHEFFGLSDIEPDIRHINEQLNGVESFGKRVNRLFSHPQAVATGMSGGQNEMNMGPDQIVKLGVDADMKYLEMNSDGTLTAEAAKRLDNYFHSISRVPAVATGRTEDLGALSGIAIKIMYQPLKEKTETKQQNYGPMLCEVMERALELAKMNTPPVRIAITWPAVVPQDAKEEAETAVLKAGIGVSNATLMEQLGYDPAQEQAKKQIELDADAEYAVNLQKQMGDDPASQSKQ